MKKIPLWVLALPIILFFASLQLVYDYGERGQLTSPFLRNHVFEYTRTINGSLTNLKFRLRGPKKPRNKIVIVTADNTSVDFFGRWPWKRIIYADLTYRIFKAGAKQIGFDIAYSESEDTIPKPVYDFPEVQKNKTLQTKLHELEGDPEFAKVMNLYRKRIVLGFSHTSLCQPLYGNPNDKNDPCSYLNDESFNQDTAKQLDRFALQTDYPFSLDRLSKTALVNIFEVYSNIPIFRDSVDNMASFSIEPDPDGYIRRYPLFYFRKNKIYGALALKMAEVARDDHIEIEFDSNSGLVKKAYFSKFPNEPVLVNPLGNIDINFRGPYQTFEYISARDIYALGDRPNPEISDRLKDAYVFFGVSASGIYDMRAFPFDPNVPGVEGHATALDNLLSNDSLKSANNIGLGWLQVFLIVILGIFFAALFSQWEAVPSLALFAGFFVTFGIIDLKVLFASHDINLPSALLMIEIMIIFVFILAIRYILEEQNKKFVREAFSKYLAPQVVDLVLKDPSKLAVGGERKELTILFSDLRGFTTFSEKMDPKTLSQFLNEYLSEMTEVIFENEGTLDKYIGDAIMSFWGAPLHQGDHALRAWKTAVEMQKRLASVAPVYKKKYDIEVSAGIGINGGEVSVGNMGSKRIFEYTVIGDHVNLASRLESLTRTYGCDILSTKSTLDLIQESQRAECYYRIVDSVIVKGKTQAIELIEILIEKPDPKAIETFYVAKELFKKREWDQAIQKFKEVVDGFVKSNGKSDPVSEMFIKRCESFKLDPPAEDWDGTATMKSK